MRNSVRLVMALVLLITIGLVSAQANPFEDCANWRPTDLEFTKAKDGTATATFFFRNQRFEDGEDFLWRQKSFTDYIQDYHDSDDVINQLELYWISDETGWSRSSSNWREHDEEYYDEWYRRGDLVVAKLHGIPYPGELEGQFMLLNKKEPDVIVEMYLNPVHVCGYKEKFVKDDMENQGHKVKTKIEED